MDAYENKCKYNIAETCCASISIDQLRELSENKNREVFDTSRILNYGEYFDIRTACETYTDFVHQHLRCNPWR
jgi:hypothetical protein